MSHVVDIANKRTSKLDFLTVLMGHVAGGCPIMDNHGISLIFANKFALQQVHQALYIHQQSVLWEFSV